MENIKRIYFKCNIIIEFIIALIFSIAVINLSYIHIKFSIWNLNYLIATIITLILLIPIIITNTIRYKDKIEKIFLTYIIPIGLLYTIAMLPSFVPDENAHIYRIYEISQGQIISKIDNDGNIDIPSNIKDCIIGEMNNYTDLRSKLENKDLIFNDETTEVYNAAQNYFPILYIFAAFAFFIGNILSGNIIIIMYFAKILNFIVFITLGYYSIKKIPFGKLLLTIYLMIPMMIHQGTSMSADCMTNAIAIFFISYTLFLLYKKENITNKDEVIYYITSAILGVAKIAYVPISFISIVLLWNKDIDKKRRNRLIIISILLCCILGGLWYLFSTNYVDTRSYLVEENVNASEQIKNIIYHPITYIRVFLNTFHDLGESYIYTFIGSGLGWLNISVPNLTIVAYIFLLLIAPFLEKHENQLNMKQKLIFLVIVLGIILLISTALYVSWTGVGKWEIQGIQGRYFLPIIILALLCLCNKEKFIYCKNANITCIILATLLNLSAIQQIVEYFAK